MTGGLSAVTRAAETRALFFRQGKVWLSAFADGKPKLVDVLPAGGFDAKDQGIELEPEKDQR